MKYKIIIPKEEPKQETLEEAAERYAVNRSSADVFRKAHREDFINGAKWQMDKQDNFAVGFAEWSVARALGCGTFETEEEARDAYNASQKRSYSEEEVRKAIQLARLCTLDSNTGEFVDLSGLTEVCTYGLKETHSEDSIIEQFKKK